ncbi:hypothetical protein EVAR_93313_1 [Eumeta japonica]|uniref:lysozyme n=1 Tax=Eumeta variegata TaxID=151549 RepID=A0A4C1UU56_EUMVA|nr:hypothetical protein EVAR_93313_1 [Eumeta japonica]
MSHTCTEGYCGPFWISRVYWVDAGMPTLPDDDRSRKEVSTQRLLEYSMTTLWAVPLIKDVNISAYEDCARDYHCSLTIIESYMARFGKDCNGDGVTDCYDYMMINHHGGRACSEPLFLSELGRRRLALFRQCRFGEQH